MGGSGRNLWLALLVVGASYLCFKGTIVEPEPPGKEEAGPSAPANHLATSRHYYKAHSESNPTTAVTPRLPHTPEVSHNGTLGMVLPLPAVRSKEWSKSELLQQLWGSLHPSEVVASDIVPWSFSKQTAQGQTAAEDSCWQGRVAQSAAFWNGRFFESSGSNPLGDKYSYQNGVFASPSNDSTGRTRGVAGRQGQIHRHGPCDISQADSCGEGSPRCRDLGEVSSDRKIRAGSTTCYNHAQDCEPTPKSREDRRDHEGPDHRIGREVESLQRCYEDQVHRTGRALQGQAEAVGREEPGDQGEDRPSTTRNSKSGGEAGGNGDQGRVYDGAGPGSDDDRFAFRGRRDQGEATSGGCGDRSITTQESAHRCSEKLISFAPLTQVALYDEETPEVGMNFSVQLLGLRDWENKPWALYGGAYVDRIAQLVLHVAKDNRLCHGLPHGDLGFLYHGVAEREGGQAQGVSGQVQLPMGLHPGPRPGEEIEETRRSEPSQSQPDLGIDNFDGTADETVPDGLLLTMTEGDHEEKKVKLDVYMFGLLGGYLGRRNKCIQLPHDASVSDRQHAIRDAIRMAWPDFETPETQFYIPVPQPDPERIGNVECLYVIVNFLAQQLQEHRGLVPVLVLMRKDGQAMTRQCKELWRQQWFLKEPTGAP